MDRVVGKRYCKGELRCGYCLVVGHVFAKDEAGVRFSLPAQNTSETSILLRGKEAWGRFQGRIEARLSILLCVVTK